MDCWKSYNVLHCIENVKESLLELKESTLNGCWKKLWPEAVKKSSTVTDLSKELEKIVSIARNVGGDGFEDMETSDIEEVIYSNSSELTEDDMEEILEEFESED